MLESAASVSQLKEVFWDKLMGQKRKKESGDFTHINVYLISLVGAGPHLNGFSKGARNLKVISDAKLCFHIPVRVIWFLPAQNNH